MEDWAREAADLFVTLFQRLRRREPDDNEIQQSLAKMAGGNHLLASAGEFGLLLAFLHNSPRTRHEDEDDSAFSVDEIAAMFREHNKKLPDDWRSWRKTKRDWILHTHALAKGAFVELVKMRLMKALPSNFLERLRL